MCLENSVQGLVIQTKCVNDSKSQHWNYDEYNLQIKSEDGDDCLAVQQFKILTLTCRPRGLSQKWILENYNRSMNPLRLEGF